MLWYINDSNKQCALHCGSLQDIFTREKLFNALDVKFYLDGVQTRLPGRVLRAFDENVLAAHDNSGGAEGLAVLET